MELYSSNTSEIIDKSSLTLQNLKINNNRLKSSKSKGLQIYLFNREKVPKNDSFTILELLSN